MRGRSLKHGVRLCQYCGWPAWGETSCYCQACYELAERIFTKSGQRESQILRRPAWWDGWLNELALRAAAGLPLFDERG